MLEPIDQEMLQAAIRALKINVTIYSATRMKDGSIQIVTRDGIQTWKPPARETQTPQKAKGKAHTSAGGTKK